MKNLVEEWQQKQHTSNAQLARLLNVHPSYITHLKAGRRNWSPKMAEAMEILSDGEVPRLQLLYPDSPPKPNSHNIMNFIRKLFCGGTHA